MPLIQETDDAFNNANTQYAARDGDTIFATITDGDEDWFRLEFDNPAGFEYVIRVTQDGTISGLVERAVSVYDERTNLESQISSTNGFFPQDTALDIRGFASDDTAIKFVGVSGEKPGEPESIGDYKIEIIEDVAANELTKVSVTPNSRYDGMFFDRGADNPDRDWVGADLKEGLGYYFRLQHKFDYNATRNSFTVVDKDGVQVSSGNGETYAFVAPKSDATFYGAVANDDAGFMGMDLEYFVELFPDVLPDENTNRKLTLGVEKEGYCFPEQRDSDAYKVPLRDGETYRLNLVNDIDTNSASNRISVLDADGVVLSQSIGGQNHTTLFTAAYTGTHFFVFAGADNDYDFKGDPDYTASFGLDGVSYGTNGRDRLNGTRDNDVLSGLKGNDVVLGGRGADQLQGDGGKDRLVGGKGRDELDGGAGKDRLVGGTGKDTFVFGNTAVDRVLDFEDGKDLFVVNGMQADSVIDLEQRGSDVLVTVEQISFLLKNTSHTDIDVSDFVL